jgi:hypothetical protein
MKRLTGLSKLSTALFFGVVLLLAMPAMSQAQGRGRGNGRGRGPNLDKKCAKFVNCHDARDGRWDGRGPNRGTGISNIYRNRRYGGISDVIYGRTRTRRIDRDGDGDYDRSDIRIERQRRAERRHRRWNP